MPSEPIATTALQNMLFVPIETTALQNMLVFVPITTKMALFPTFFLFETDTQNIHIHMYMFFRNKLNTPTL